MHSELIKKLKELLASVHVSERLVGGFLTQQRLKLFEPFFKIELHCNSFNFRLKILHTRIKPKNDWLKSI